MENNTGTITIVPANLSSVKRPRWDSVEADVAMNELHAHKFSRIVLQAWCRDATKDTSLEPHAFAFLPASHYQKGTCKDPPIASRMQCENTAPSSVSRPSRPKSSGCLSTILEHSRSDDAELASDGAVAIDDAYFTPWGEEAAASFHSSLVASELRWKYPSRSSYPVSTRTALPDSLCPQVNEHSSSSASSPPTSLVAILTSASKISPLAAANQLAFANFSTVSDTPY